MNNISNNLKTLCMKKLFILIAWVSAFFMSCSKDDSNDILWKPDTLVETVWEGRIIRDNIENKIGSSDISRDAAIMQCI